MILVLYLDLDEKVSDKSNLKSYNNISFDKFTIFQQNEGNN